MYEAVPESQLTGAASSALYSLSMVAATLLEAVVDAKATTPATATRNAAATTSFAREGFSSTCASAADARVSVLYCVFILLRGGAMQL